jgi:hypothetical protein
MTEQGKNRFLVSQEKYFHTPAKLQNVEIGGCRKPSSQTATGVEQSKKL